MNVFISGGAGFIGSHLCDHVLSSEETERLIVYDNLSSGSFNHIQEYFSDSRFAFIEGDMKELDKLTSAMAGMDMVFHLAANADIAAAVRQPNIDFWEGTYLTQNALEAMRINGVPKIIYTSGSGVYGESWETQFAEDYGPCEPISTYGASKLASEALISAYCHMFGIVGRVFRFANVVGPRQTHGVGYDFVNRLKQDPFRLSILGDGSQCKSYIHVEDVLAAILLVERETPDRVVFDIFNVATDDYLTVTQIADLAVAECGFEKSSVQYLYTGGDRGWKGDVPKVRFNVSKLKGMGWHCRRSARDAVRDSLRAMIDELDTDSSRT